MSCFFQYSVYWRLTLPNGIQKGVILMSFWLLFWCVFGFPIWRGLPQGRVQSYVFLLLFGNVLRLPHSVSIDLLDQKRGTWGTLLIREWVNQQMYENVQNPPTKSQETPRSPRGKSALSRGRGTPRTPIHQGKKRLLQGTRNPPPPLPSPPPPPPPPHQTAFCNWRIDFYSREGVYL